MPHVNIHLVCSICCERQLLQSLKFPFRFQKIGWGFSGSAEVKYVQVCFPDRTSPSNTTKRVYVVHLIQTCQFSLYITNFDNIPIALGVFGVRVDTSAC